MTSPASVYLTSQPLSRLLTILPSGYSRGKVLDMERLKLLCLLYVTGRMLLLLLIIQTDPKTFETKIIFDKTQTNFKLSKCKKSAKIAFSPTICKLKKFSSGVPKKKLILLKFNM